MHQILGLHMASFQSVNRMQNNIFRCSKGSSTHRHGKSRCYITTTAPAAAARSRGSCGSGDQGERFCGPLQDVALRMLGCWHSSSRLRL